MTEFDTLRRSALDSLIGRAWLWVQERVSNAFDDSRSVGAVSKLWTRLQLLMLFGVAFVTYAVLLFWIPPYVATGIPRAWFFGIGAALLMASTMSATLAMAVRDSAVGRFCHWLVLPETHQGANPRQPQK